MRLRTSYTNLRALELLQNSPTNLICDSISFACANCVSSSKVHLFRSIAGGSLRMILLYSIGSFDGDLNWNAPIYTITLVRGFKPFNIEDEAKSFAGGMSKRCHRRTN